MKGDKIFVDTNWDCLIIQAALKSGCNILLSEDLSDSQVIESL